MTSTTAIPFDPSDLKRNDHVRLRRPGSTDFDDCRVTGVKPDVRNGWRCVVVNVQRPCGRRQPLAFDAERKEPAFKVVPVGHPSTGLRPKVGHEDAPNGYLMDEVGDIAYRYGDTGVWLRIDGRWTDLPLPWRWSSDKRAWTVL